MRDLLRVLMVGVFLISACGDTPIAVSPTAEPPPVLPSATCTLPPTHTNEPDATVTLVPPTAAGPSGLAISEGVADRVESLYRLGGHTPRVAGLAFLDGGNWLASVSKDFSLRVWDAATGEEARPPVGRGERVYNTAFAPTSGLLAVEGEDQTIRIWDARRGQELRTLAGHGTHLLAMAFSPDGRVLASSGDDALIKLWDVDTGSELNTLSGHLTPVTSLAFSPDGSLLASGAASFSSIIMFWDAASGEPLRTLTGHRGNVHSLAFSPDGRLLASAALDRTLRLWKVGTGHEPTILQEGGNPVYGLAFSPDGSLLASSADQGGIVLWDVRTGRALRSLSGHTADVLDLAFSPDGSLLASGGIDSTVLLWGIPDIEGSLAQGGPGEADLPEPTATAAPIPLSTKPGSAGGRIIFSSYRNGESKIFSMEADGSDIVPLSRTGLRETRPAWSPDGTRIAYVRRVDHSDHEIYVMNADGTGVTRLTVRPDSVESEPAWSPDGSQIAFVSNERPNVLTFSGRFHIWVMNADGSDAVLLTEIGGANTSPDWSPDGSRIAFDSTRDGNLEIYVMNSDGSEPVNLTMHPAHDTSPAWSPDGSRIAFVSDRDGDQEIYVMNADGSGEMRLTERPGFDKAPSWSPDGQYIVFYRRHAPNNTEVFRMRADGTEQVRLTYHSDFDGFPSWQPLPLATIASAPTAVAQETATPVVLAAELPAPEQLSVASTIAALEGLPLDRFFDESFRALMLRDPEWVTAEGLASRFGTHNGDLTNLSDAYVRETQQLQAAILELLRRVDRETLAPEQRISYDVYEWYLDDLVRGQQFMYYDYPITHFLTGVQYQLIQLFSELHPIATAQDAEDYVRRLWQVADKFDGLIEGLNLRREAGVVLPKFLFPWVTGDIGGLARSQPRFTPFFTAFEEKLGALGGLDASQRRALLQAAEEAIAGSVIPAFAALNEALNQLQPAAPSREGVWQFPEGRAYYGYILRHHTTAGMTADEIHELGLRELDRIHGEMRRLFEGLGYSWDEGIPALYARLAREGGIVSGSEVASRYEEILDRAERNLGSAFDVMPKADLIVIAGPEGDYYVSASLDGSRPGAFYARVSGGSTNLYAMPTLAYHEGVPGHHLQIALAQESDLPLFRNVLGFTGYTEGWALYAEQLAHELGWYDGDPYGELGRLQGQAFRAARLVVDTGLHAKDWTFDQALRFMVENTGHDRGFMQFEVGRYVAWPGQATAYMVGMLKILELRERAMEQLGEGFDLREFHRIVLSNGSMPLEVLERVVDDYIQANLNP